MKEEKRRPETEMAMTAEAAKQKQLEPAKTAKMEVKAETMKNNAVTPDAETSRMQAAMSPSSTTEESTWCEADESSMNIGQRCVYRNRKRAIELYRRGCSPQEIFRLTGMGPGMVSRMWKKCCTKDPETGSVKGYQALVPKSMVKSFIR